MIHVVLQCWVLGVLQTAAATGNANLKVNPATGTLEVTAPLVSVRLSGEVARSNVTQPLSVFALGCQPWWSHAAHDCHQRCW
jgi:hypothetical protein